MDIKLVFFRKIRFKNIINISNTILILQTQQT